MLCILTSINLISGCSKNEQSESNYSTTQLFNYSFHLQNSSNRTVPKANINLYLPLAKTSTQHLLDHSISGLDNASVRVLDDGLGNQLLSLPLKELPAGYSKTLKIATTIGFSETPVKLNDVDINRYLQKNNKNKTLIEQLDIELPTEDNLSEKVQKLSKALSTDGAIFESNRIENDKTTDKFANDCLEHADRFIAGAKAIDIPARALVGFMKEEEQGAFVLTCWPEVYDQSHWQMVDLTNHKLVNESAGKIIAVRAFISLEDYRQSQLPDLLSEGYGLKVSHAIN